MIPSNEAILFDSQLTIFTGFGPRHAAGLAERPFFIFDIIIYLPMEHLRSALYVIMTILTIDQIIPGIMRWQGRAD